MTSLTSFKYYIELADQARASISTKGIIQRSHSWLDPKQTQNCFHLRKQRHFYTPVQEYFFFIIYSHFAVNYGIYPIYGQIYGQNLTVTTNLEFTDLESVMEQSRRKLKGETAKLNFHCFFCPHKSYCKEWRSSFMATRVLSTKIGIILLYIFCPLQNNASSIFYPYSQPTCSTAFNTYIHTQVGRYSNVCTSIHRS